MSVTHTCSNDGCNQRHKARGLCAKHYDAARRRGEIENLPGPDDWEPRFWAKVDKNGPVPECAPHLGRCWVWTASVNKRRGSYGQFSLGGRMRKAHAVSWEIAHGPPCRAALSLTTFAGARHASTRATSNPSLLE